MERGQRVQIRIEDMTEEGQGLGKNNGLAIFVKDAVIGDLVSVELTKVKKKYAFGKLIEILEPSEDRIEPFCSYHGQCGGCPYGSLSYEAQLQLKEKQIKDKLVRLGGIENPKVNHIIGMEEPFRYRNKAAMPVSTGGIITRKGGVMENLGEPAIGFFKSKSHQVINCKDCQIQSEPAMAVAEALRQFMKEDNITAYDPKWEKGLMRHLVVKTAMGTGQVMVVIVINGKGIPNIAKLVEMLDTAVYNIPVYEDGIEYNLESVVLNINKKKHGPVMGDEYITVAGKPTIEEKVGQLRFEISPLSFYQVNPVQMKELYDKAIEYADIKGDQTILDLYCGVGTIGLFAAARAEEGATCRIIGIESVKGAVLDANRNAVINNIVNARYVHGKAEEELPKLLSGEGLHDETLKIEEIDAVFIDPPRNGCDERLLDAVCKANAKRIVYVSCDAGTLARDIKFLTDNGYSYVETTPVDMFPWTGSTETVSLLIKE